MLVPGVVGSLISLVLRCLYKSNGKLPQNQTETISGNNLVSKLLTQEDRNREPSVFQLEADDTFLDTREKYLLHLPYEGASNQFYCLLRALYLARELNRTLLIPPLMPSRHNALRGAYLDWRHVIDFGSIDSNPKVSCKYRFLSHIHVPQVKEMMELGESDCFTYGRWRHFYVLGLTFSQFAGAFNLTDHLQLDYHDLPQQKDRNSTYLLQVFAGRRESPLLCAANLQHLSFGNFMNTYLDAVKFSSKVTRAALDILQHSGIRASRFGAVHWRRGDFSLACKNKVLDQCWPDETQLRAAILKAAREQDIDVFLIGTNDPEFSFNMNEDDIDIIRIEMLPLTTDDPAPWTDLVPVFVDTFLFTYCDYFIGNRYSTVSRSAIARRQQMGLGDKTTTF